MISIIGKILPGIFVVLGMAFEIKGQPENKSYPNILLIMTDDQGWGDVHSHGNPQIDTPVIDRLAREGARFERFFVSPVCAPTRASLLTGRYSLRTGTQWVTFGLETMRPEEITIAEVFRKAGYATGIFGKWHNGSHYPSDPLGQGFETFVGFSAGHWNNYFDAPLLAGRRRFKSEGYITDVLTDSTVAFIRRNRDSPFFAYVPYNAPHGPFQVPDRYFDKYKEHGLNNRTAAAYGMVENIDDNIERLLDTLDNLNLSRKTIVIFLTDNGPNGSRYNGHMNGTKGSVHEGGSRVPLFIRWPAYIEPGKTIREISAHIDLLPTLAELAGVSLPEDPPLDGISLAPVLLGNADEIPADRKLFTHQSRGPELKPYPGAVRTRRWRLVNEGSRWELFDMFADPGEHVSVSSQYPELVKRLSNDYNNWFNNVTRKFDVERRIPVGYEEAPVVALPAVESRFSGNLRFAGESGWANDWLTGWPEPGDQATWLINVMEEGLYRVSADYTASEAGARLGVSVNGEQTEAVIETVCNPPYLPSPDRVPRIEVYAKKWARLDMGTIRLNQGKAKVTLELLESTVKDVLDLQTLYLEKIN